MTAIWLVIVQWISSALGGYLTGQLRTKCVGGLGRPGTPSFSRHGCSSAKGSKTRGVAPSYRRPWRNTRRRDRPSFAASLVRASAWSPSPRTAAGPAKDWRVEDGSLWGRLSWSATEILARRLFPRSRATAATKRVGAAQRTL